jgi:hypothetical protein
VKWWEMGFWKQVWQGSNNIGNFGVVCRRESPEMVPKFSSKIYLFLVLSFKSIISFRPATIALSQSSVMQNQTLVTVEFSMS